MNTPLLPSVGILYSSRRSKFENSFLVAIHWEPLFSRAGKDAILGDPVGGWALDTLPTGGVFAVEERSESFFRSAKLGNAKSCCN